MIGGMRYSNDDIIYTMFKKHYCPDCNKKLKRIKEIKVIDAKSPEAKKYCLRDECRLGTIKLILIEFMCPKCQKHYSIKKMKKIEGLCDSEDLEERGGIVDDTDDAAVAGASGEVTASETVEATVE